MDVEVSMGLVSGHPRGCGCGQGPGEAQVLLQMQHGDSWPHSAAPLGEEGKTGTAPNPLTIKAVAGTLVLGWEG